MKCCRICGEEKPLTEFNTRPDSKDGRRSECKICGRAIIREHYKNNKGPYLARGAITSANRKERVSILKKDLYCISCGESRSIALDFHHKDSKEKEHTISDMLRMRKSDEEIATEIAKCVVLCCICHRIVHFGDPEDKVRIENIIKDVKDEYVN